MKIKTTEGSPRHESALRQREAHRRDARAAAAARLPQRVAHLRAGHRRPERDDARVGGEHRDRAEGRFRVDAAAATSAGAKALGKTIAERLIDKGIKRVVFDRGGFLYHGRIRAVARSGARGGFGVLGAFVQLSSFQLARWEARENSCCQPQQIRLEAGQLETGSYD